ncbi:hypothetical protein CEG14_23905 [Bordetella genomosp. 1]|uniref:Oxidoreductase n=1 Tax=Bordetella genomosp. 1 TaxID=1395607 RepID=A0A261RVQ1_9BORD|nr:DUF934 domain-containing protein [Bordetella genomosp. 1]MDQ8035708.1 DUF934 domain-containing protein [Bordetella sp.]OZI28971.1 hypothetical protein CEG14_23905 [Bordetella genomosp. 1]
MSELNTPDARLIRAGRLEVDTSRLFEAPEDAPDSTPADEAGWIVPLATWLAARDALASRQHPVAVQLPPDTDLTQLLDADGKLDASRIAFIAISFPAYTDGRGYSLAQLLRRQYHWTGELRAVGDVMIDTVYYQARVGFDSFLVKPGHDPQAALDALHTFSVRYQQTYPVPQAA